MDHHTITRSGSNMDETNRETGWWFGWAPRVDPGSARIGPHSHASPRMAGASRAEKEGRDVPAGGSIVPSMEQCCQHNK